jgi:hypothetical protein
MSANVGLAIGLVHATTNVLRCQGRDETSSMRPFVVSANSLYPLTISFNVKRKPKPPIYRLLLVTNSIAKNRPIVACRPWTCTDFRIILRWGSVQLFDSVNSPILRCSHHLGRYQFSGLRFHCPAHSARRSSARPRRVSRCFPQAKTRAVRSGPKGSASLAVRSQRPVVDSRGSGNSCIRRAVGNIRCRIASKNSSRVSHSTIKLDIIRSFSVDVIGRVNEP